MTITVDISPEIQAELTLRAARQGLAISAYAAIVIESATQSPVASGKPQSSTPAAEVVDAIERLRSFGKTHRLSLGDVTIRELRHEARP